MKNNKKFYDWKALDLKTKRQVHTLLSGNTLSKLKGEGYTFSELREYQLGDDIRKINWTITAKLGKPYIKELHENREISVAVCALLDASLYFGFSNDKQKILAEVATLLAYSTQSSSNVFTGISYTQNTNIFTTPTKQLYAIEQFSKTIFNTDILNTTLDYNASIRDLFTKLHKPSLVFILGDFLQDIDLSLLAQKHEIIVIIIRDKDEECPKKMGEVILSNPQNTNTLHTHFGTKSIKKYLAKLKENDDKLIQHFSRYNIRHIKIFTEDKILEKLLILFA